jgi:hypothetical protein
MRQSGSRADLADRLGEDAGAAVGQVVAVHRRDDDVAELHAWPRSPPGRLGGVERFGLPCATAQ